MPSWTVTGFLTLLCDTKLDCDSSRLCCKEQPVWGWGPVTQRGPVMPVFTSSWTASRRQHPASMRLCHSIRGNFLTQELFAHKLHTAMVIMCPSSPASYIASWVGEISEQSERREIYYTVIVGSLITAPPKKKNQKTKRPTCSDGLPSFSDKAVKVFCEAPLVFRSIRIARSSSLEEAEYSLKAICDRCFWQWLSEMWKIFSIMAANSSRTFPLKSAVWGRW